MRLQKSYLGVAAITVVLSVAARLPAGELPVALDGKCPVCLGKMNKLVDGDPRFSSSYDGKTYHFPSADQKTMFEADPAKFAPVLGGDCVVCLKDMGKRVAGVPEHAVVHRDRLYLFPSAEIKTKFEQSPDRYADADLALEGNCPVCLVKMDKVVKGEPNIAVVHDGLRYLFPGEEQKIMFESDPAQFTPALGGNCTVCRVDMDNVVAGQAEFHRVYKGRLYVFPGQAQLAAFDKDPGKYADTDLALSGNCAVCKVKMNKDVPGKAELAADYRGKRYLFPDAKTRGMFLAAPDDYATE
jgi:YHS domain-containing protein